MIQFATTTHWPILTIKGFDLGHLFPETEKPKFQEGVEEGKFHQNNGRELDVEEIGVVKDAEPLRHNESYKGEMWGCW